MTHAIDPFEDWAQGMLAREELNATSVEKYRPLWNAWRWWLSGQKIDWSEATADTVEKFLQGPAPRKAGRRQPLSTSHMSNYTKQRYWRVLRGVYEAAVKSKRLTLNPVLAVEEDRRPTIKTRDRKSGVLEPMVFQRLKDPRTLISLIKVKTDADWWHIRDRAMLAVLIDTGISVSELIALRGQDLHRADHKDMMQIQAELLDSTPSQLVVDVMETKQRIGRKLEISEGMAPLVQEWMTTRSKLLLVRAARKARLSERSAYLKIHSCDGPLFIARRDKAGMIEHPPMESVTVYHAVSVALDKVRKSLKDKLNTEAPYVAKGPAVIRNSVIQDWLRVKGPKETLELSGLKNAETLRIKTK